MQFDLGLMGAYLSSPITEKESESGQCRDGYTYGCSSMQGWRRKQEDAHLVADLPEGTTLFGVFDGHGGREVSNFAKRYFPAALSSQPTFAGDLPTSLVDAFHRIDELLLDKSNLAEINQLKRDPNEPAEGSALSTSSGDDIHVAGQDTEADESSGKASVSSAVDLFQRLVSIKRQQAPVSAPDPSQCAKDVPSTIVETPGTERVDAAAASEASSAGATDLLVGGEPGEGGMRVCTLPRSHVDAGSTSIVAALRGQQLYVANAGDSRAVLSRRGRALVLSTDHKPSLAVEAARIAAAGGWVTPQGRINGNLNLSRALGDLKYKNDPSRGREAQIITAQPDVLTHTLERGDEFLVLACDGVWDCMTNQQVVNFVRERLRSTPSEEIAEQMLDHCIADDPRTTGGSELAHSRL